MCGVMRMRSSCISGLSAAGGSTLSTSSAAPAIWPGSHRRRSGVLVDQRATRRIDEIRAGFHLRQCLRIDEVAVVARQRRMQRDVVGLAQQRGQIHRPHPGRGKRVSCRIGIVSDHLQPQPPRLGGRGQPDAPAADQPQYLALQPPHVDAAAVPLARLRRPQQRRQPARLRQQQRDGMGRHLVDRIVGHVGNPDAVLRCRIYVDGIQPCADTRNQLAARHAPR